MSGPEAEGTALSVRATVLDVLDQILHLQGRSQALRSDSGLLGAIPELDSMAVVGVITSLEERFGFAVEDDEIDGSTFATLGTLIAFVDGKLRS